MTKALEFIESANIDLVYDPEVFLCALSTGVYESHITRRNRRGGLKVLECARERTLSMLHEMPVRARKLAVAFNENVRYEAYWIRIKKLARDDHPKPKNLDAMKRLYERIYSLSIPENSSTNSSRDGEITSSCHFSS